jgi:hypothetical protein
MFAFGAIKRDALYAVRLWPERAGGDDDERLRGDGGGAPLCAAGARRRDAADPYAVLLWGGGARLALGGRERPRPGPCDDGPSFSTIDDRYMEASVNTEVRGVSVDTLLRAFYQPMFDIARLVQTSAVERSLAAAGGAGSGDTGNGDTGNGDTDSALGKDQWRLCCELPTLLEKLWADLYEQRRKVPVSLRRTQAAEAALVDGCMYVYRNMDQIASLVAERLAGQFMHRLIFLHDKLDESGLCVLSGDVRKSRLVIELWQQHRNRESLARYFEAQMGEQLPRASVCGVGAGVV